MTVDHMGVIAGKLVQIGKWLDARGWVPATGGNFSYRLSDSEIAITVSGRHKGELVPADIMRIDYNGASLDGQKPSDETLLHTGMYKLKSDVHAILHTHPRAAVIASLVFNTVAKEAGSIALSGYELLKIFPEAKKTHETTIELPVFDNSQDMPVLQKVIDAYYAAHPNAPTAYLVRGHGLTVGAKTIEMARYTTEAIEELLAYKLAQEKAMMCGPP